MTAGLEQEVDIPDGEDGWNGLEKTRGHIQEAPLAQDETVCAPTVTRYNGEASTALHTLTAYLWGRFTSLKSAK